MKNLFASIGLFGFLLCACAHKIAPQIALVKEELVAVEQIQISKFINHTDKEIERNKKAIVKIKETVNGECFKSEIMSRKMIDTQGKTNAEILDSIINAKVTVSLQMYRDSKANTVGYTYPSSNNIWMNRKYHDRMDLCDVGANLSHEILGHKIGYKHASKASKSRPFSVPYSVGYMMEKCCKE